MPNAPKLDAAARDALKEQLGDLAEAESAIEELMAPHRRALAALQGVRDLLLEQQHGVTEVLETCEGCSALLFEGDEAHRCGDGPVLCEACAPTHGDCIEQAKERLAGDDLNEEERADLQLLVESNASMSPDELAKKAVFPL